jgi:hypothetical protein
MYQVRNVSNGNQKEHLGKASLVHCHSPVDLSDFVFTNVHISCLRKANREVLRRDIEREVLSKIYWPNHQQTEEYAFYCALSRFDLRPAERRK